MFLQAAADARQVVAHRDAGALERRAVADPGPQEQLRCPVRAAADHRLGRDDLDRSRGRAGVDPRRPVRRRRDPLHLGAVDDPQAVADRVEVPEGRVPAHAVGDVHR